jgi:hypothetical protein
MGSVLTHEQVLEAARWVWVPEGADELQTAEYRLVRYPDRYCDLTFPRAQVVWSKGDRPACELIDELRRIPEPGLYPRSVGRCPNSLHRQTSSTS